MASPLQPNPTAPRFGNAGLVAAMPTGQRWLTQFSLMKEGATGNATTAFLQDTATVWTPKAVVSRSWAELFEISFLEFLESALFYFGASFVGQHLFGRVFAPKENAFHQLLETPLEDVKGWNGALLQKGLTQGLKDTIPKATLNQVVASKAAIIIAALGVVALAGEYALNFAKNLATEKLFKVSEFSDVVKLSDGQIAEDEDTPAAQKARKRIAQCIGVAGALVGLSALIATVGKRSDALQKPLRWLVKHFDFSYNPGGKWLKYGLSMNQLRLVIIAGVISYLDAARDGLERLEIATRLAIVAPYLATGGALFNTLAKKLFKHRLGDVLEADGNTVKSMETVLQSATKSLDPKAPMSQQALGVVKSPIFRQKLAITFGPLLAGIGTVGLGVAILNRVWTRHRFEAAQKKSQEQSIQQSPWVRPNQHKPLQRKPFQQFAPQSSFATVSSVSPLSQRVEV